MKKTFGTFILLLCIAFIMGCAQQSNQTQPSNQNQIPTPQPPQTTPIPIQTPQSSKCNLPAGFTCVTYKLYAGTGKLYIKVGQGTGHELDITGIACTQNTSTEFASEAPIAYPGDNGVTIQSGSMAILSDPLDATTPWLNVSCTTESGNLPSDTTAGAWYSGRLYIRYKEIETGLTRIIVGTLSTKFE